ncbi:unnamed protein product [Nippostrongylus brasiliensis]|uniref:Uncharacterized protein n=1 Tax=Nippostrongylus brasiliensis TaxID=27835 RepID=A0A0N4YRJ5_NIPBR|nr:unnamed protein product [Nippostrongylus brasiliensis]
MFSSIRFSGIPCTAVGEGRSDRLAVSGPPPDRMTLPTDTEPWLTVSARANALAPAGRGELSKAWTHGDDSGPRNHSAPLKEHVCN